jgi:CheY-like chemotaxis protein
MGGRVEVDTSPGSGSRFTVSVPVHAASAAGTCESEPPPAPPKPLGRMPSLRDGLPEGLLGAAAAARGAAVANAPAEVAPGSPTGAAAAMASASTTPRRCRVLLVGACAPPPLACLLARVCVPIVAEATPLRVLPSLPFPHRFDHADDHNLNLRLCKRLLETQGGMEVETADDGDVALAWLRDSYAGAPGGGPPVDIVLMDMQMPRMDGMEATKQFRHWERAQQAAQAALPPRGRLPIIALSANVFHENIAECTAAGMDGAAMAG